MLVSNRSSNELNFEVVYCRWRRHLGPAFECLPDYLRVFEVVLDKEQCQLGRALASAWCSRQSKYFDSCGETIEKLVNEQPWYGWHEFLQVGLDGYQHGSGERDTVFHLWKAQGNAEKLCALLMCASLFPRIRSRRKSYTRDLWPPYSEMEKLESICRNVWNGGNSDEPYWHHSCTHVLPVETQDYERLKGSMDEVVEHFSNEHIQVMAAYVPVVIVATS